MAERITHVQMARRVAAELAPGHLASLGAGLPLLVPAQVRQDYGVTFLSSNGALGLGPAGGSSDPDLVDAGGEPTGLQPGSAVLSVAEAYGLVRGGHLDMAVVEALQVSQRGELVGRASEAGWPTTSSVSTATVVAMMEHTRADGGPKILEDCTLPNTRRGHVSLIVTDVAVIRVGGDGLVLEELAPGWTVEEVQSITGATLAISTDLREMSFQLPEGQAPSKVYSSGAEALADMHDGAVVMLDGFAGPGGMAQYLIVALRDQGAKNLTMISNTAGIARSISFGSPPGSRPIDHSLLVDNGQIRKAVASFPVSPSPSRPSAFELVYRRGEAELELVPQGTLAERIRAGGYGIGAFYTPTGAGTQIAEGKETQIINGREYVLEHGLRADYALLRAHAADRLGNLVYRGTSRNFNAVMAPAAAVTIVEVDEIVEPGDLDPDAIVTPGVFVQRIVKRPAEFSPYETME